MANVATDSQDLLNSDEHTVTAVDVLQAQAELEREAADVLPGRFDQCTRSLGPTRQSAYACLTCSPTEPRGICYACSIACHSEHNLVELFERRRFLCDCATDMPKGNGCQIETITRGKAATATETATDTSSNADEARDKITILPRNRYDHNYLGRFCRCDKEYNPDIEAGTMYQCAVCEDWFHDQCIDGLPQQTDRFEEFCCKACIERLPLLTCYALQNDDDDDDDNLMEMKNPTDNRKRFHTSDELNDTDLTIKRVKVESTEEVTTSTTAIVKSCPWTDEAKRKFTTIQPIRDYFFATGWRDQLCRCQKCMDIYQHEDIAYLLAIEDAYEPEKDEDSNASLFDLGMQKLASMDRTQAINGLMAYNQLCGEIKSFLGEFASTGKIVTKTDVEAFFAEKMRKF
ncbi:hypothetical protein BDF22DRAFT_704326 [Syncephalis plumigaleata]|nr:hypothetical protein BDF22DRAFT_704326 [Syncephalis plumigaleata]